MITETFARRFAELAKSFGEITFTESGGMGRSYSKHGQWRQWATSAQSLIRAAFGDASPHYTNFVSLYTACQGSDHDVGALGAVFRSASEDFLGGYVFDVDLRVSGEVFGDFVALARKSLSEGHKDVAAVLACAALEDALKRFAIANNLLIADKTMQEVVNALKTSGLVSGAQKSLLDAMPRIRNAAMHAEWVKLSEPDVSSVIGFVEQFLLSKFSGG
ncbi:MAG: DUF4145 domain-containing protein [Rhodoferax sp.]|uniref:DUF4145 domain-containing protein n=1 Tax=Rhodoferax sp. TaxID=50421 RepID=UPI0026188AAB|nr:DUF4145 domain-containing protein [Rhodoferax sp.]MDD5334472.1 DUF4145 domain-containing protein [Rhodoferax sp.]